MMTPEILASVKKVGTWLSLASATYYLRECVPVSDCLCHSQHFVVLTGHKPVGRQWVTKEQYTRYFMLCYEVLYPDSDMTQEEQREALQVFEPMLPGASYPAVCL